MRNLNNCIHYLFERIELDSDFEDSLVFMQIIKCILSYGTFNLPVVYRSFTCNIAVLQFQPLMRLDLWGWTMVVGLRTVMAQMVGKK